MKTGPDWNDLAYFAAIAREGGLARAAAVLGVSPATLSRRMKAFETAMGRRLFVHGAEGYALTPEGRALAERTRPMEEGARQVTLWRDVADGPLPVRISAGTWTATDLAERISEIWSPSSAWLPEFIFCDLDMDIARREVDIGVRNRRPEQPWLSGQRIGGVDYAVYGASDEVTGWIGPSENANLTPSIRWVLAHHGTEVVTRANTPQLAAALARAGVGRMVLPTFAGDRMEGLIRLSDPIAELRSEQWLVAHHEARHDPAIRAAIDAIAAYLKRRDAPAV